MVFVMFLIGLLAVVFVTALVLFVPVRVLPVVLVIAGILLFCQFFFSDKIAAFAMGAREVTPEQVPDLHGIIDRLCAMADMPKPRVAVAETPMLNAFATGRNPNNAVVCVTTGLLDRYRSGLITEQELEGILAHELSHVAHRDVMVMTIASFLGILAGLVARMAFWFGLGGNERDDRDGGVPVQLIILLVSVVVYAVSFVLTMALSRYRELAADRAGALLTGNPSALASALQKVTGDMARIPTQDLRQAEPFNAFYFAPAFNAETAKSVLSSHPSLQTRLENLARISQQLGR
jgi:heat shock protein HtpX